MFDFLKKKIGGFVDKLTKKEEEKGVPEKGIEKPKEVEKVEEKPAPPKIEGPKELPKEKPVPEKPKEIVEKPKPVEKAVEVPKEKEAPVEKPSPTPKKEVPEVEKPKEVEKPAHPKEEPKPVPKVEKPKEEKPSEVEKPIEVPKPAPPPKVEEKKPKERIKVGALGAIKSLITREVEITGNDLEDLLEEFELELLEADVDISVAESIKEELTEKLVGSKVKKDDLHNHINKVMKETLVDMMTSAKSFGFLEKIKQAEKPVRIMFLGINGSGKTTTIAKVAKLLMDNDYKVVLAAADTFRAAAIEQISVHGERLGVKVIKRDYGSDPTSVAYDATNYAKAHGIDVVLIDTAGRQDTNISLINEMKKMSRVIQPDLKIYIGESVAGNAIIQQISSFNKEIGIDAVILTKLDCDPKGGTMLSINKVADVPILYVGTGQNYDDLEEFDAGAIVGRIVE